MTFAEFSNELQKREGHEPLQLVDAWPGSLIDEIAPDIASAIGHQALKGSVCPLRAGSSNLRVSVRSGAL